MTRNRLFLASLAVLALCAGPAFAKREKWTGPDGKTISAEPSDVVGPFAIFDTGDFAKRVPLHLLNDADLARFNAGLSSQARQSDWTKAKGTLGATLASFGTKVDGKTLKRQTVSGPEPLLYVVFLASSGVGPSWEFSGKGSEPYQKLKKLYPNDVEFILYGVNESTADHENLATSMNVPFWTVSPRDAEGEDALTRLRSSTIPLAILTTRDGTPLHVAGELDQLPSLFKDLEEMLRMEKGFDPRAWNDRQSYVSRTHLAKFTKGETGPVLVGDPFDPEALHKAGIESFDASLSIKADGSVKAVMLKGGGKFPEKFGKELTAVLKQALYAPAVKDGHYVDSDAEYHFAYVAK